MKNLYNHVKDYILLCFLLMVLLLIYLYPLPLKIWDHLPNHPNPSLHLTSTLYSAKSILSGHLLPDTNAKFLYPYGNSLCWNDYYLFPAMVFIPFYLVTHNIIFSFNAAFILLWIFSGLCMYYFLKGLTNSKSAAFFGAFAWILCPYRTSYYMEYNMQLLFGIPLSFAFMLNFFKTRKLIYILFYSLALILQALSSWYYTLIIGICSLLFFILCFIMKLYRPRLKEILFVLIVGAATYHILLPYATPYLENAGEARFESTIKASEQFSADISSYLSIYEGLHSHSKSLIHKPYFEPLSENLITPGYAVYGLGFMYILLLFLTRKKRNRALWLQIVQRTLTLGILLCAFSIAGFYYFKSMKGLSFIHLALEEITQPVEILFLLWLLKIVLNERYPAGSADYTPRINVRRFSLILGFIAFIFFIISLGPEIRWMGQNLGHGFIYYIYDLLFPLEAAQVLSRYAIIVIFTSIVFASIFVSLTRVVFSRRKWIANLFLSLCFVICGLEYIYEPFQFENKAHYLEPPACYQYLKKIKREYALLEAPSNNPGFETEAMFFTHYHSLFLLNGWSGFPSVICRDVVADLYQRLFPTSPTPPLSDYKKNRMNYSRVYPLRYLLVHLQKLSHEMQKKWSFVYKNPPQFLKPLKTFDQELLFEFAERPKELPESKVFSSSYIQKNPFVTLTLDVPTDPDIACFFLHLNLFDKDLMVLPLSPAGGEQTLPLYFKTKGWKTIPNKLIINYYYKLNPLDFSSRPEFFIGKTGTYVPANIELISKGRDQGDESSILINNVEYSLNRRGLNVVLLDDKTNVTTQDSFDPLFSLKENKRCMLFFNSLKKGTIVLLSVRNDFSSADEAVLKAIERCGFSNLTRGQSCSSFAGAGVVGALPRTALEKTSNEKISLLIGKKIHAPVLTHFECKNTR